MTTYEQREAAQHRADMLRIDQAPMAERQEARAEWKEACAKTPAMVSERVGWLLNGSYGKGSYDVAQRILAMGPNANKVAGLSQLIAALEWKCPRGFAVEAWHELTPAQQENLRLAIQAEITYAEECAASERES